MVALAILGGLALALALAASSSTEQAADVDVCRYSADNVPLQGRVLAAWVRCDGRSAVEVRALVERLQGAGDAEGARAIAELWERMRSGAIPAATEQAARDALGASDQQASSPAFVETSPVPVASSSASTSAAPTRSSAPSGDVSRAADDALRAIRASIRDGRVARTRIPAVRTFQALVRLEADGLYGSNTRAALAHYTGQPESALPEAAYPTAITWAPQMGPPRSSGPAPTTDHPAAAAEAADSSSSASSSSDRPRLPSGANADSARRLAGPLARRLRGASPGQYRDHVRAFQRAAGLRDDGIYGGTTANALAYFGILDSDVPPPHQPPQRDDPRAAYPPRS